uniref:non-specific serine/threonine protein kinase n=1 Tax=Lactuca sativa TaxID=4236 RepID=A0A9R1WV42_LACSA|nr:hypothetical protein LSAT_V11C900502200 [Lactuca sativa]
MEMLVVMEVVVVKVEVVMGVRGGGDGGNGRGDSKEIITEGGGAYLSDAGIQVTPEDDRMLENRRQGRATYFRPLHLWDKTSTEIASFSTNFSFVIDSKSKKAYADGLTFFLAKNNSFINSGGAMGLPIDSENNVMIHPFVAVEFDTYSNPKIDRTTSDHVGININSLTSARFVEWWSNITSGRDCSARIDYESASKFLRVSFTDFRNNTLVWQDGLNYNIDLRDVLPEWVIFGFSAATGTLFEKNTVKSWSFKSSVLGVDESVKGKKGTPVYLVGLIVGACVVVALLAMIAIICWRKRKSKENEVVEVGSGVVMNNELEIGSTGPRSFSYHELSRSTGGFAGNEKLGEGGFGEVYKGFLEDSSTYIAVKRVSKSSKQGIKEFASEVNIISRLRHRNLVKLIGWCHDNGELMLVYEFMQKGSLDLHLFKGKSLLSWGTRYKIARGLASALLYLHEEWEQCVLHRDIKSSNVMLDANFNAKLGDFGLAKLVDHDKGSQTTMLAGTLGYMAPECAATGKASRESDVFSFGVVALEIACGRKPIEERQGKLVEWVWELYGTGSGTLLQAVDPRLGLDYEEEDIKRLMIVGLWCVHPDPYLRPTMRQAIHVLKYEASLPLLPSKMPIVSYVLSRTSSSHGVDSIIQTQSSIRASNIGLEVRNNMVDSLI